LIVLVLVSAPPALMATFTASSLTAKNKNGETPLDMAIKNDKTSIAAYLRGVGAKPAMVGPVDEGAGQ
jgi:ankyrin repeat protein